MFGEDVAELGRADYLRFRLGPDVAIALGVRSKVPGKGMVGRDVEMLAVHEYEPGTWGPAEAERIIDAPGWHDPEPGAPAPPVTIALAPPATKA